VTDQQCSRQAPTAAMARFAAERWARRVHRLLPASGLGEPLQFDADALPGFAGGTGETIRERVSASFTLSVADRDRCARTARAFAVTAQASATISGRVLIAVAVARLRVGDVRIDDPCKGASSRFRDTRG